MGSGIDSVFIPRLICCGSIRHAQGRMQECDSEEFAECVIESHPLYAFLLRMLLEGNVHNRPGDGCGLSRSMYEFVKAEIEYCQKLCEEDSMRPAQSYTFHPALEAETVKELTELSESSTEMSVARQFGQSVYTSRLKKSTGSLGKPSGGLYEIPRDVLLKMEFVKRQDPLRAEAIVLCAYVHFCLSGFAHYFFCHDHVQVASRPASPRGANYTGYLQIGSIPCDFDAGVVWATVVLFEILKYVEIVVCMPTATHLFTP
jgi:hypothetical protein